MKEKYVIWDGITEVDYLENPIYHDYMILSDGSYTSVQKRRQEVLDQGAVPTILFACKSGEHAHERKIQGKIVGIFSHYFTSLLKNNPDVTYRDAIRLVNQTMKEEGIKQNCEVVCRTDVLDMKILNSSLSDAAHITMLFDMCRTYSKNNIQKIY